MPNIGIKTWISSDPVQWHINETFEWDVLMLPVIIIIFLISYFSKYIDFDFVSYVLCDISITELFLI